MTDWIVFRFSPDMPEEYRPSDLDGLWMPANQVPTAPSIEAARKMAESPDTEHLVGEAVAYPTDRVEFDELALEVAQVWEIRPLWKIDEQKGVADG